MPPTPSTHLIISPDSACNSPRYTSIFIVAPFIFRKSLDITEVSMFELHATFRISKPLAYALASRVGHARANHSTTSAIPPPAHSERSVGYHRPAHDRPLTCRP